MIKKKNNKHSKKNKRAQVWLSDYTIGLLLFTIAAIISIKIIINGFQTSGTYTEMKNDASRISEILLSEGYPANWNYGNSTDMIRPGLLTNKRLDSAKITRIMNNGTTNNYINYTALRPKLQTKYDFAVIFKNNSDCMINFTNSSSGGTMNSIGYSFFPVNTTNPGCLQPLFTFSHSNMIKINRLAVYNSTVSNSTYIVKMVVYLWN